MSELILGQLAHPRKAECEEDARRTAKRTSRCGAMPIAMRASAAQFVYRRRLLALIRPRGCVIPPGVNRLIDYLRQHLMIDFQGDLTVAKVRELLAGDETRETKVLLAKLVKENSTEDMMLVLADCLLEPVQRALTDDVMREQIRMYTES